ncbi:hypothetical protein GGTG_02218 [Gaeumannomyces tritici R3-111a-1]|uniref:Deacetylase sirtuin-type domain-containing protein n=1 Tax=Gaeumannomyces tritici (strain R3-111a-1) TaxID=644352 RepID=J3NLR8_GAET3|nr:hypothetical protein GGTG_02218 [Gaeumannomyces tritici R3-111a-1]EJT82244.1 hypothetical protein GGTG_02218 [Gaeumannomyces tritici R3-111a-1]
MDWWRPVRGWACHVGLHCRSRGVLLLPLIGPEVVWQAKTGARDFCTYCTVGTRGAKYVPPEELIPRNRRNENQGDVADNVEMRRVGSRPSLAVVGTSLGISGSPFLRGDYWDRKWSGELLGTQLVWWSR